MDGIPEKLRERERELITINILEKWCFPLFISVLLFIFFHLHHILYFTCCYVDETVAVIVACHLYN